MSQKSNLDVLFQALDKANRSGVFTLQESAVIHAAFGKLTEELNNQDVAAKGDPQPHPPVTPIHPKP